MGVGFPPMQRALLQAARDHGVTGSIEAANRASTVTAGASPEFAGDDQRTGDDGDDPACRSAADERRRHVPTAEACGGLLGGDTARVPVWSLVWATDPAAVSSRRHAESRPSPVIGIERPSRS